LIIFYLFRCRFNAENVRKYLRMQGSSLKNLGLVRAYSVPIKDRKASELVTWHVKALQRALDLIWNNIEWGYRFPELDRKVGSWS
jgi:putative transposase